MGTRLIKNSVRGRNLDDLTDQMNMFVLELLATNEFNPTEAARKCKYKFPAQAANKLLKNPKIQAALGKAQRERSERVGLNADDVLEYLRNALFFNPLHYFRPSEDSGKWEITDLNALPDWVGRLIDGMEVKVTENKGVTTSFFKVTLVSKATALTLAMKHIGVEKHELKHSLDWDNMYSDNGQPDGLEVIEGTIERAGE